MILLLFLCCSSPFKIWAGDYSIGLSAIGAVIFILWRWMAGGRAEAETGRIARWLIRGLWAIAVWGGILWLISENWAGRGGMFLDWVLAALVFSALLRTPVKDAKQLALLFVLAAIPNALLGLAQHISGVGLAPKDFSGWSRGAAFFPVYGFFGHSNDLAVYLYWPFLMAAGLFFQRQGWSRLIFAILAAVFGLALYWTVSRSILLTLGAAAVILAIMYFLPRRKAFLAAMAAGLGAAVLLLAGIFLTQNVDRINRILSGRLDLWGRALQVIAGDACLLPFGYLSIPPAGVPVFWLPHNIYILAWIEYGWPGIILLIGMACFFILSGLRRYPEIRKLPLAAWLWTGLAGVFLINGMASLYLHESYIIVYFICVAALWVIQLREIDSTAGGGSCGAETDPVRGSPARRFC